ncbi:PDZ domain-containing protein [Pirellulaceae bacterium SH467]
MNCKRMVAAVALLCWMASPSLVAQDFLKQLEEKILKRQAEAKAKESAAKESKPEQGASPLQLNPPVAMPKEDGPKEGGPIDDSKNASKVSEEENELLPPPRGANSPKRASAVPPPLPKPQQANPLPSPPLSSISQQPRSQQSRPQQPGGGYLGMTVESSAGGGFGLNVAQVTPDSPAYKAGFRPGDRLIGVEGAAVATVEDFAVQLAEYPAGTPIRFLVDRRGKNMSLVAVLMDRNMANRIHGNVPGAIPYEPVAPQPGDAYFGVNVANMSEAFRKQFAIGAYRGASVTDVISGSPAERAGLRPGDCIVSMRGEEVKTADNVYDHILTASPGELLEFTFYRGAILQRGSAVLVRKNAPEVSGEWEGSGVTAEMLTPEYVSALQLELERVATELSTAQQRIAELESRLRQLEPRP